MEAQTQIMSARDFGLVPDTGKDMAPAFISLCKALREKTVPAELVFEAGSYDVYGDSTFRKEIFITNTMTEAECGNHPEHRIALPLEGVRDLHIRGNGAEIIARGTMMYMLLEGCENITLSDMTFDFANPSMLEMEVVETGPGSITCRIHDECPFRVEEETLYFVEDHVPRSTREGARISQRVRGDRVERIPCPFKDVIRARQTGPQRVTLEYQQIPDLRRGDTIQFRYTKRGEVGFLLLHSKNISFDRVNVHYMHGLGIVGQFSETLSLTNLYLAPRKNSERGNTAFADFMHFNMCRGKITIKDCYCSGAHDDPINIHGVHFKILSCDKNTVKVRFMHNETYGFQAFFPGDSADFIDAAGLYSRGEALVTAVAMEDLYTMTISFDRDVSSIAENAALENLSWIAEAEITGNAFYLIPTRGILYSSRGRAVIRNNIFHKTHMNGICIASDASYWYESGMVKDVLIEGNIFVECGNPVINIDPGISVTDKDKPVHRNIRIEDNTFNFNGSAADPAGIFAKSVRGLVIKNNRIRGSTGGKAFIGLEAVTEETIE
jgi:hypothetical protein